MLSELTSSLIALKDRSVFCGDCKQINPTTSEDFNHCPLPQPAPCTQVIEIRTGKGEIRTTNAFLELYGLPTFQTSYDEQ